MQIKRGRWFLALVTATNLTWIAPAALAVEKQTSKGKVAVVNESVITQEYFDREMGYALQRLANMGRSFDDSQLPAIKKDVLEGLINAELLCQESQRKGIKVEEAAINEQLETLRKQFPSEDEFKTALTKANLSEVDLRSQIRRGLTIQQFITRQFVNEVTISEKQSRAYYDSHPDSSKQPEQVRARHIVIRVDPKADKSQRAEARKTIENIQKKLKKGEDFATLAKGFSQGPSSSKGGDLGFFKRGRTEKPFEQVAFALKPGEVSDLVETKFGYHLIKVIDRKAATTIPYDDIKKKIEQYLKNQKAQKEVSLYVEKLKENAKVERFLTEAPK